MENQLLGPYRVRRRLATGGMADIWLATKEGPLSFRKEVVIKTISPEVINDPEIFALFIHEAGLHAALQHPNIAQLYDFSEFSGIFYMVVEYVSGITLREALERARQLGEPFSRTEAIQIASKVLKGLQHIHALGIVHRDISPENVLISHSGDVKLCDLGLATVSQRAVALGEHFLHGKIRYMAPEQTDGRPVDNRADLYAVGVCLYEMLTLKNWDLNGRDLWEMEIMHTLRRALAHAPMDRFATACEFLSACEELLASTLPKKLVQNQRSSLAHATQLARGISALLLLPALAIEVVAKPIRYLLQLFSPQTNQRQGLNTRTRQGSS